MTGNEKSIEECSASLHRVQVVSPFKMDSETTTSHDCEEQQVRGKHLGFSYSRLKEVIWCLLSGVPYCVH